MPTRERQSGAPTQQPHRNSKEVRGVRACVSARRGCLPHPFPPALLSSSRLSVRFREGVTTAPALPPAPEVARVLIFLELRALEKAVRVFELEASLRTRGEGDVHQPRLLFACSFARETFSLRADLCTVFLRSLDPCPCPCRREAPTPHRNQRQIFSSLPTETTNPPFHPPHTTHGIRSRLSRVQHTPIQDV